MMHARQTHPHGRVLLAVLAVLAAAGCRPPENGAKSQPPGEIVQSSKARVTSPNVPGQDSAELVAGNTTFALRLYEQARAQDGNIFLSPHSISIALAMTYAGARAETEQQMAKALEFTLSQDRLHPAFNALDLELARRGREASGDDSEPFRLNIVNRIWGRIGYSFLEEFLDVLAENYGAGLTLLDFAEDPEASRIAINDWVAEQTEGRIEDLIPPGAITPATPLVLTNAIYFLAAWSNAFEKENTANGPFHLLDGTEVTVPLMNQEATYNHAAGDGYQAVELPYEGHEVSMVILLPDAGGFEAFEETLDAGRLAAILAGLSGLTVDLTMPRFTFEWDASLKGLLTAMGMGVAFRSAADFSGMTGARDLLIQDVIHKAFVAVDEEGTEAAAATAVIFEATSAPPTVSVTVRVDRPFIFLIRDRPTGAILFLGRVLDPR